jgi:hypothetical protein
VEITGARKRDVNGVKCVGYGGNYWTRKNAHLALKKGDFAPKPVQTRGFPLTDVTA